MKKFILTLLLLAIPSLSCAEWQGEVWVGQYFNQTFPANPDYTEQARHTAGIELGYLFDYNGLTIRPYTRFNALMHGRDGIKGYPSGIQFFWGGEMLLKDTFFIQAEHMCWHPIDSGGTVYEYDMIKIGIRFGK